ncbi:hypothetical protein BOTBODRAFT_141816 [Botryobasidium botryosum FD-172 SS1]|uniref:Uncharacterized protein n=1 Tax=Botryobasidium botryosum (strain FD-172 SS1) TaxID=930990 RepID=A0A067N1H4_BOTB1|nr:hypothetical protein BOTBODRAFT_141816 [Botryobasidium botryosum FD-172 SS1]
MSSAFSYVVDDASPMVTYSPNADMTSVGLPANLTTGWNSYNQSIFVGQGGNETSYHATSRPGADFTLTFQGTGISLYGVATGKYNVSLDNGPIAPANASDLLAKSEPLPMGTHTITFTAADSGLASYWFDRAEIIAETSSNYVRNTPLRYNEADFHGQWVSYNETTSFSIQKQYYSTNHSGDYAKFSFLGSAVFIEGLTNRDHGRFNVTLDGNTTTINGYSPWAVSTLLYAQAGLDPNLIHELMLTNIDEGKSFIMDTINITNLSHPRASHHLSTGVVIALSVTSSEWRDSLAASLDAPAVRDDAIRRGVQRG